MNYIGIDVGGMSIKCALLDEYGKISARKTIVTDTNKDGLQIIDDIAKMVNSIIEETSLKVEDISGVGLGFPGSVYDEKGEVRYCCNINMIRTPVVKVLKEKTRIKNIKISNDANCAVLGETYFGAAKGAKDVLLVTVGTGIGTGIIVDGRLLRGNRSAGAEGGHITINIGGVECGCGKKGHFEAYASTTALIEQTQKTAQKHPESILNEIIKKDGLDGKTLFKAMECDDKAAISTFKRYIKYLGTGLVNLANIFYPEIIIIGGGISKEGDKLILPLQRYVSKNVYGAKFNPKIKVVAAELKNDAGIVGAAALTMEI